MEGNRFDSLTRRVGADGAGRRQVMRTLATALLGSALGGMVAQLGVIERAGAKSRSKHKRHANRGHDAAHAEGKHRKKQQKHKRRKQNQSPPTTGVDDLPLCRIDCEPSGGRCCPGGVCIDAASCCDSSPACPDGSCPEPGECCDGEWLCPGNICHPIDECCPGTKRCGPTACIAENTCCDKDPDPTCDSCSQVSCVDGTKVCSGCQGEGQVCCGGACLNRPCNNGCDISDDCSRCNKAPSGKAYCLWQDRCVDTTCPPGKQYDETLCRCIQVECPNVTSTCPPDWTTNLCGSTAHGQLCYCLRSVAGDIHCSSLYNRTWRTCATDSDCDAPTGGEGKGFCEACQHICWAKGCPEWT